MTRRLAPSISRALAAGCLLAASVVALADDAAPAVDREAMIRQELRQTLVRLAAQGAFDGRDDIAMSLQLPAERFVDLGVVVDPRAPAEDGVRVLGVTPGAGAHALGVRAGDVLTAVNGQTLVALGRDVQGNATAVATLKQAIDALPDRAALRLDVSRAGQPVALSGDVSARYLPALRLELGDGERIAATGSAALPGVAATSASATDAAGCGRVSTFHVAPRSQQLHAVKLLQIDGKLAGTTRQETFRLAPGRHELLVAEQIDSRELPDTFTRQRPTWGRKTLTVDVAADQTVLIAARLDDARATTADYWQPVAWKTIDEPCR